MIMDYYKYIKRYYEMGYYSDDPAHNRYVGYFVEAGEITEEQFTEITGKPYVPPVIPIESL
ncbi:XkdX family protein [Bacillus phage 031MP002]|nr:XkdX family protein [Bacillus phage 031MP003]QFG05521.1 XkdX family protein [Bacillus phage 031MP002]